MKFSNLFIALAVIMVTACSSDDDTTPTSNSGAFSLPLSDGNSWVYNVAGTGITGTPQDNLYVEGNVTINGTVYKKMKTQATPIGFFSGTLNNNAVRYDDTKLFLTGDFSFLQNQGLPITSTISLSDFIVFNKDASSGTQLDSQTGTLTETINSIPITLNYELTTTAGETLATKTVNGVTYNNVRVVTIALSGEGTVVYSGITLPALAQQNLMTSNLYFVEGIGVINATTTYQYQLNATVAGFLPNIPASNTSNLEEELDSYNVN